MLFFFFWKDDKILEEISTGSFSINAHKKNTLDEPIGEFFLFKKGIK